MLLINISNIRYLPSSYNNYSLLDITNSIYKDEKLNISDFSNPDEIHIEALQLYKDFIRQIISDKKIFSYRIFGLPIYWLTDTSVKHPISHWGKNFCVLLTILKNSSVLIQKKFKKITIILPSEIKSFNHSLKKILHKYNYKNSIQLVFLSKKTTKVNLFEIIKSLLSNVKSLILYRNNKLSFSIDSRNFFLISSLEDKHTYNVLFSELKKIYDIRNKDLTVIPLLEWKNQQVSSEKTPKAFIDAKPNIYDIISILFRIFILFFKIKLKKNNYIKIDGVIFKTNFLKYDLIKTLQQKTHLFFLNKWLINFFNKNNGAYYYSDEFYQYGRTISSAIKSSENYEVKSYGIQHGHFNEIHTVYTIIDKEIEAGIPLPNKFIVWGGHYKGIFKKNNTTENNFILPLGNPKYLNTNILNNQIKKSTKIKKILWCLTSIDCFNSEWHIIKNGLKLSDFELTIRLHPLGHISHVEISNHLEKINYRISSEKSLLVDLLNSDLILTSAHSTVFLDAMIINKKVIRIITNRWIGMDKINCNFIENVKSSKEINDSLNYLENINYNDSIDFLELNQNKWLEFIDISA